MANLEIRKNNVLKAFILNSAAETAERHIRNGYPGLMGDYEAGLLTIRETDAISPVETPEDAAERAERQAQKNDDQLKASYMANVIDIQLNIENRLRALEAAAGIAKEPQITLEQFKADLKSTSPLRGL
jgi:hypothetical protein